MPDKSTIPSTPQKDEAADSPVVWFAVLERARIVNDTVLARRARAALARLGVRVLYTRAGAFPPHLELNPDELKCLAARVAEILRRQPYEPQG